MEIRNSLLSRTISFLRFPMIFFILYLHVALRGWSDGGIVEASHFVGYEGVRFFFVESISRIFVPCFFFISGFLFFYYSDFSRSVYCSKMKRRFRTLVVPYLFWNLFAILLYYLGDSFVPSLMSRRFGNLDEFGVKEWVMCFWGINDGFPINPPLWFLRDLIVLSVLSPLVYLAVRWGRHWVVCLTALLWFLWGTATNGFVAPFFFVAGAWLGVKRIDFVKQMLPWRKLFLCLYVCVMLLGVAMRWWNLDAGIYLQKVGILFGLCAVVSWSACLLERHSLENRLLEQSSFLVYAYHALPLLFLAKLSVYCFQPDASWELLLLFFLLPIVVSLIGIGIYALMDRYLPGLLRWIGGR